MHYGTTSGDYDYSVDVGNFTSCTISGLQEGATYYFAVTAYIDNCESDYSDEISYTIPAEDYWTDEPMRNAVPQDTEIVPEPPPPPPP